MLISEPNDDLVPVGSVSFKAMPRNVIVLPVLFENQLKAVIELASLKTFNALQIAFLEQLTDSFGTVLNSIEATMQTEGLLTAIPGARRVNCRRRSANCSRPTISWNKRRNSSPNATSRSSARTTKSSRLDAPSRSRRANWR